MGNASMRNHLTAMSDPYVFASRDVTIFRAPAEEGYFSYTFSVFVSFVSTFLEMLLEVFNVFVGVWMCLEVFGCVRMRSDAFGCVRMRSYAFGCVRMRSQAFGFFRIVLDVLKALNFVLRRDTRAFATR